MHSLPHKIGAASSRQIGAWSPLLILSHRRSEVWSPLRVRRTCPRVVTEDRSRCSRGPLNHVFRPTQSETRALPPHPLACPAGGIASPTRWTCKGTCGLRSSTTDQRLSQLEPRATTCSYPPGSARSRTRTRSSSRAPRARRQRLSSQTTRRSRPPGPRRSRRRPPPWRAPPRRRGRRAPRRRVPAAPRRGLSDGVLPHSNASRQRARPARRRPAAGCGRHRPARHCRADAGLAAGAAPGAAARDQAGVRTREFVGSSTDRVTDLARGRHGRRPRGDRRGRSTRNCLGLAANGSAYGGGGPKRRPKCRGERENRRSSGGPSTQVVVFEWLR